jgi:hypothetical protein
MAEFCACGLEKGSNTGCPLVWLALHPSNQPLVVFGNKTAAEEYVALHNNPAEWTIEVAPVLTEEDMTHE